MWKVRPTTPISPARQFVQNGCKLSPVTGILLHATGPSVPALVHAAEHCFWQIGAPQLQKLCVDLGVVPSGPNLYDRVVALLQNILHPLSDDRLQALLQLRAVALPSLVPTDLDKADVEDVLGKEGVAEFQDLEQITTSMFPLCSVRVSLCMHNCDILDVCSGRDKE